ncbi:MAG: hypothetical protein AAF960_23330 [Bacteroidota bacterium]
MIKKYKKYFQYLSYLQYPLMVTALFFTLLPFFQGFDIYFEAINKAMIFAGLSLSFSTLQDTTKTQNKLSKKIYENPTYAKWFIGYMVTMTLSILCFGLFGLLFTHHEKINEIAFGLLVLGIGMIGMIKMVMEMADYHRLNAKI